MLVDAHTHLQPHGEQPPLDMALIRHYVDVARVHGLDALVITEHLFRFREAYDRLYGWWDADPNPYLAGCTRQYWDDHVNLALPDYVALIEAAKNAGLPVYLGLEMDWIPGRADDLRDILAPFAWDLVLGSVHWLGGFGIDQEEMLDEWVRRDVDKIYDEYGALIEELAGSRLVNVLAHSDLPKIFGRLPSDPSRLQHRIVAAAAESGCALEINTNGLNKTLAELYPAAEVLREARRAGVPITFGSDAHRPPRLGENFAFAIAAAQQAGYDGYARFEKQMANHEPFTPIPLPLSPGRERGDPPHWHER